MLKIMVDLFMKSGIDGLIGVGVGEGIKEEDLLLICIYQNIINDVCVATLYATDKGDDQGDGMGSILEEGYNKIFEIKSEIIHILKFHGIGKEIRSLEDLLIAVFQIFDIITGHDIFFGENAFELCMFLKIELSKLFSMLNHGALGDFKGLRIDVAGNVGIGWHGEREKMGEFFEERRIEGRGGEETGYIISFNEDSLFGLFGDKLKIETFDIDDFIFGCFKDGIGGYIYILVGLKIENRF